MRLERLLGISLIMATLLLGIVILGHPGHVPREDVTRTQTLDQLAPQVIGGEPGSLVTSSENEIHEPVRPTTVDFSRVTIDTDDPSSKYNRWLRGEIDLNERESILGEAERAEMLAAALQQDPDPSVQEATAGPSPLAPNPESSFEAIDFRQSGGAVPPDPEMAVGPDHIIAVVNVAVAIYDKSGTTLLGPTAAINLFSQSACQSRLFDPNVLYDEEVHRWIIAYDKGSGDPDGGYCLLASQSPDPLGTWYEYYFPLNDASGWIDFPHAGVGDTYIFMGGNVFGYDNDFIEGRIFAFDKFHLYSGLPVAAIQRGLGSSASTPQPLNLHGANTRTWPGLGNEHYILTDPYDWQRYHLRRWNPSAGTLLTMGTIDLGQGYMPVDVPQQGGEDITANFPVPLDFEYRNGYGWTTMTVSCDPGFGVVDCIRWAQIDLSGASLGPAGRGVYGSNLDYRFFPDLAVNHCNDMAIAYTKSSESMYPSIWLSGRRSSTGANTLEPEAQLRAGEGPYDAFDVEPHRWGDYTGMTIDPDGETFWYLGQYSKDISAQARWGTYVGSFHFNGCNAPDPLPKDEAAFLPLLLTQPVDASRPER